MKRYILNTIFILLVTGCKVSTENSIDLQFLSGYWEIDSVITANGDEKKYNFNAFIDYFETKDSIGFRYKVEPKLNGNYKSNFQKIKYKLVTKKDTIDIQYKTSSKTITDKLFLATDQKLGIKTDNGSLYYYRKYSPIIIDK